jgi:hypothetical protein
MLPAGAHRKNRVSCSVLTRLQVRLWLPSKDTLLPTPFQADNQVRMHENLRRPAIYRTRVMEMRLTPHFVVQMDGNRRDIPDQRPRPKGMR